ncbi:DNA polymerase V family protein [Thermodesulfovibrionales bacterium]|nr:DNA polymerase V family protein [Thermodesulfovibrionales bacterium]MCL0047357.1 DNA polymerase V family protein [Thermodesulfovibrionales bacterium]MCL0051253.1 DNA polymerase V family protein [Thermodesulfovibrionales bacterium]
MMRFEEVQMKIAESAKNYLEICNMQVFIEQFRLERESRFSLTLPDMKPPFPISATVSFTYDVFQTGMTMIDREREDSDENDLEDSDENDLEDSDENDSEDSDENDSDVDASVELDFSIRLPVMEDCPDIEAILEEISEEYPDTEPILISQEIFPAKGPSKDYKISYTYDISLEDVIGGDIFDEVFEELKGILELIHKRTKNYIDSSWGESGL